jgi:alpha-tubulin suppressor-like RCC1 family protein
MFATVSVGGIHTCAVATGGVAYCWGWNSRGQLGDGTSGGEQSHPARVAGDVRFATLSAGDRYTCGLTAAGAAYCWGLNVGQLGDGTTTDRSSPVLVAGGLNLTTLTTGFRHTCGLAAAGDAYCWGVNGSGQLGDGTTTDRLSPVPVASGLVFTAVSAGDFHTCGVTAAGAAYCWGANGDGQLGDGTTTSRSTPVRMVGDVSFAAVNAGGFHTCGLTAAGAAYCWGANSNGRGQLGDGTTTSRSRPVPVAGGVSFATVSAGFIHTCAVTVAGAAYCWGDNSQGQLGDGTTTSRPSPVRVAGDVSFAAVHAGGSGQALGYHTCGVTAAGAAYCWGQNARGQLGDGTTTGPETCRFEFLPDNARVPCSTVPTQVVSGGREVAAAAPLVEAAAAPLVEKEAEHVAAMKWDLRNLVVAEEAFFGDSLKYSSKIGPGGVDLRLREGNILLSLQLTADGWAARIGRANTQTVCAIFVGSTPLPPATEEGNPACT